MTRLPCSLCNTRPAIFHVEQNGRPRRLLCDRCAQSTLAGLDPMAARFLENWLPVRGGDTAEAAGLPGDHRCPSCGMTFAEFERIGLLGCGDCYRAFRKAVLPALRMLHGEEGPAVAG